MLFPREKPRLKTLRESSCQAEGISFCSRNSSVTAFPSVYCLAFLLEQQSSSVGTSAGALRDAAGLGECPFGDARATCLCLGVGVRVSWQATSEQDLTSHLHRCKSSTTATPKGLRHDQAFQQSLQRCFFLETSPATSHNPVPSSRGTFSGWYY